MDLDLLERITPRVARARLDGVEVAYKALPGRGDLDLVHEQSAWARMSGSEAVPRLVALGETPGERFIATEWIEDARPIVELDYAPPAPLPEPDSTFVRRAVERGLALLRCLEALHRNALFHRDLDPAHCLLDPDGELRLVSLGRAARTIRPGIVLGSFPHLAPEQVTGDGSAAPADLYGAGTLLFGLATGSFPFYAESDLLYAHAHVTASPPDARALNPAIPEELDDLLMALLEKSPADRPLLAEAREILAALLHGLDRAE